MVRMYVKWDFENHKILKGPQGIPGSGENWYPYREFGKMVGPNQYADVSFEEGTETVICQISDARTNWETDRVDNYPGWRDQMDMLYRDIHNGTLDKTGEFYTAIKAVKDTYPKD